MSQYQQPPGTVPVNEVLPSDALPPPDFRLKESYAYSAYFDVQPGEEVDLTTTGFTSYAILGIDLIEPVLQQLGITLAEQGQELLAWAIYEKPTFDISVPNQICILDQCFTPPFAGDNLVSGYDYYLYFISRAAPVASASTRALVPLLLAAVASLLIVAFGFVLLWKWSTGAVTLKQVTDVAGEVFKAPGRGLGEVTQGITTPLVVGGIFLGLMAVAFPLITNVQVHAPIGPATISAGARSTGGSVAAQPRRTR